MHGNKEIFMITNFAFTGRKSRKFSFRVVSAFVAVVVALSVTASTLAFASAYTLVTVTDGKETAEVSVDTKDPYEIVKLAGFTLDANDDLDLSDYSENKGGTIFIERANIIRVEDNGKIGYFVGFNETLSDLFGRSGIVINDGDEIGEAASKRIFDGMKIFIKRAFTVSVDADGIVQKLSIARGTVADALKKANVVIGADDIVSPSLETKLNGFTQIKVSRVSSKFREETVEIDYETKVIPSADMYADESIIVTHGENGIKTVVYKDKYIDGEFSESEVYKETIEKEAVNEIKKVGTKKREVLSAFKNTSQPISDLSVPSNVKLDKNGIPVNYAYCVEGKATAYTGDTATASGRTPMPGHIAVDPKQFPYGTELYIVSSDGSYVYGYCIAADTGGFVKKGNTTVDLYMDNTDMCMDWGNRGVKIYVLN